MQSTPEAPDHQFHGHPSFFQHPTPSRKKHIIAAAVVSALVLIGGASAYILLLRGDNSGMLSNKKPSLTMYYNDGRTVLWDSSMAQESDNEASGFVARVKDDLENKYGQARVANGEWRITTTLDVALQQSAKEQIAANQSVYDKHGITNGALIAEDVTNGNIVSWIGGFKDLDSTPDTVAQPIVVGSLAMPLTYTALLENNTTYGAGSTFIDEMGRLDGYICNKPGVLPEKGGDCLYNYDRRFVGKLTLRQALGSMRSVPAAKAGQTVGATKLVGEFNKLLSDPKDYRHFACYDARSQGYTQANETQCYLSTAQGDGLIAPPYTTIQAYATLANGGKNVPQRSYLSASLDGETVESSKIKATQVIREDTAYIISDILSDQTNNYLPAVYDHITTVNGSKVSAQNGVTPDGSSASIVEYTSKYVIGFWAFPKGSGTKIQGAPELATEPTATGWLKAAHATVAPRNHAMPSGIKQLPSTVISFPITSSMVGPSPAVDLYPSWYQ
jgi:membrane peptidoglycan carboxypeptidase